jgi:type IV secretory pathway VirD2 relaxase
MARDAASPDGRSGRLINETGELEREAVDAFAERGVSCRHQFRFIVSPERGGDLDLERFTRDLIVRMQRDLGTRLDCVAAVHHDTDQPHIHLMVNGRDDRGGDLVISRDYIANGLRYRAMDLATDELGYRSDRDILHSLTRDLNAERFTALDRRLLSMAETDPDSVVDLRVTPSDARAALQRRLYLGRLAYLTDQGLAHISGEGRWRLEPDALDRLRGLTQHREIQRHVQRHVTPEDRAGAVVVIDKATLAAPVSGRVLGRGLANELTGAGYLVVAGTDGKTYYAALSPHAERHLDRGAHTGDIVTLRRVESRASGHADRNIVALARRNGGVYDPTLHIASLGDARLPHEATPERYVEAHVVRLDALASRGFVTREPDGRCRVPPDLIDRLEHEGSLGRDNAFVRVDVRGRDLHSQSAARAFTWLDEQLVADVPRQLRQSAVRTRFQDELIEASNRRIAQLVPLGLAAQDADAVRLDPSLRTKLDSLERTDATVRLSAQYGSAVSLDAVRRFDGRVTAIENLASGPHAVVVAGDRFALVPAERGLARQLSKGVSLTLDRAQRDGVEARVRYRVLDALDLSPSLGR